MALLLVGTPFFLFFYKFHGEQLVGGLDTAANSLSQVVSNHLETAMMNRTPHAFEEELTAFSKSLDVERVFLLDLKGKVRASSDPLATGKVYSKQEDPSCAACHRLPPAQRGKHAVITNVNGLSVFRHATPILNQPRCFSCHEPTQRLNGMLIIDLSMANLQKGLNSDVRHMLGLGFVMLLVTIAALHLLIDRLVLQKLKKLAKTSLQISQGNLAEVINIPGNDEITHLAENLNRMTASLKKSFEEAKHHKEYLEDVINSIADEIIVVDRDRRVVLANSAYLTKQPRIKDDIIGEACFLASQESSVPCNQELIMNCPVMCSFEDSGLSKKLYTFMDADGNDRFVELHCFPLRDRHGDIYQVIEVRRDITERRHLEAGLCHSERLASLGLLVSGVSHEINNPLASIIAGIQGLRRRLNGKINKSDADIEGIEEYLSLIYKEALRAKSITERLLGLSQKSDSCTDLVNISKSLSETIALLRFQAAGQNVAIMEDLSDDLPMIKANDSALRQVFLNLILNALQAITKNGTILIKTWLDKQVVCISIEDDGCGIDRKDLKRIFEPFISRKPFGKGTGLGLFISDHIIRQLRGEITVESEVGKGSRFTISLPINPE
ncbi:MAG: PAS domain-containing protein [Acidobacteria bacterium]|nr:PAS domain-containing protein [Acidobacteriota bacterium]MBI3655751.1 PAS domain-containing protein [Acidobacteriota bacterium]